MISKRYSLENLSEYTESVSDKSIIITPPKGEAEKFKYSSKSYIFRGVIENATEHLDRGSSGLDSNYTLTLKGDLLAFNHTIKMIDQKLFEEKGKLRLIDTIYKNNKKYRCHINLSGCDTLNMDITESKYFHNRNYTMMIWENLISCSTVTHNDLLSKIVNTQQCANGKITVSAKVFISGYVSDSDDLVIGVFDKDKDDSNYVAIDELSTHTSNEQDFPVFVKLLYYGLRFLKITFFIVTFASIALIALLLLK